MQNKGQWGFTVTDLEQIDLVRIIREARESDPKCQVIRVTSEGEGFCLTTYGNARNRGLEHDEFGFIVPETEAIRSETFRFGIGNTVIRPTGEGPLPKNALVGDGRTWVACCGDKLDLLVDKTPVLIELF